MAFQQADFIPNTLPQSVVQTARNAWTQGNYTGAWQILAQTGDRYADNAAAVIGGGSNFSSLFFKELVRTHWEQTVGIDVYNTKFNAVAQAHLNNYLTQLEGGFIPSTQDILNSYQSALEDNGINTIAAFDVAWAKAIPGTTGLGDSSWAVFLGMDISRITTSETANDTPAAVAESLIVFDFGKTINNLIGTYGYAEFQVVLSNLTLDGHDALVDYITKDILGGLLDFIINPAHGNEINPLVNSDFTSAQTWAPPPVQRDPLALDLDGDGIETIAQTGWNGVLFDHNGDGQKTGTGWLSGDDGFLTLDKNNNGQIDNGNELFGDNSQLSNGGVATDGVRPAWA